MQQEFSAQPVTPMPGWTNCPNGRCCHRLATWTDPGGGEEWHPVPRSSDRRMGVSRPTRCHGRVQRLGREVRAARVSVPPGFCSCHLGGRWPSCSRPFRRSPRWATPRSPHRNHQNAPMQADGSDGQQPPKFRYCGAVGARSPLSRCSIGAPSCQAVETDQQPAPQRALAVR